MRKKRLILFHPRNQTHMFSGFHSVDSFHQCHKFYSIAGNWYRKSPLKNHDFYSVGRTLDGTKILKNANNIDLPRSWNSNFSLGRGSVSDLKPSTESFTFPEESQVEKNYLFRNHMSRNIYIFRALVVIIDSLKNIPKSASTESSWHSNSLFSGNIGLIPFIKVPIEKREFIQEYSTEKLSFRGSDFV